jgi:hypothetical protein
MRAGRRIRYRHSIHERRTKSENTVFLVFGLILALIGGAAIVFGIQEYIQDIVPIQTAIRSCVGNPYCYGMPTVSQSLWDTVDLYAIGGVIVLLLGLGPAFFAFKREDPSPKQFDYEHPERT